MKFYVASTLPTTTTDTVITDVQTAHLEVRGRIPVRALDLVQAGWVRQVLTEVHLRHRLGGEICVVKAPSGVVQAYVPEGAASPDQMQSLVSVGLWGDLDNEAHGLAARELIRLASGLGEAWLALNSTGRAKAARQALTGSKEARALVTGLELGLTTRSLGVDASLLRAQRLAEANTHLPERVVKWVHHVIRRAEEVASAASYW